MTGQETKVVQMVDIVGTPFSVGDKVATDTLSYKTSSLRVGEVTEFDGKFVKVTYPIGGRTNAGKPRVNSVYRRPEGVVKVAQ